MLAMPRWQTTMTRRGLEYVVKRHFPLAKWFDGSRASASSRPRLGRFRMRIRMRNRTPNPQSPPNPQPLLRSALLALHAIIFHIVRLPCQFFALYIVYIYISPNGQGWVVRMEIELEPESPALSICAPNFVFNFWLSTFLAIKLPPVAPVLRRRSMSMSPPGIWMVCLVASPTLEGRTHFNLNCQSRASKS